MTGKYYSIGFDTGYDIASENIAELTEDNQEQFISDMAEHESEVYRQFSPFEFLAKEINDYEARWNREGELWECYDNGVAAGIQKAVDERLKEILEESVNPCEIEACPVCGGAGMSIGTLGKLTHHRCEACGWIFSK